MSINSIRDIRLARKNVFLRLDLNVPMEGETIQDDTRIRLALPTIEYLLENSCKVVIASHLGRPKPGKDNQKYSLEPVGLHLAKLLQKEVVFVTDYTTEPIDQLLNQLGKNQFVLLENVRFTEKEEENDKEFAKILMKGMDVFINDAFGALHRAHATTAAIADLVKPDCRGMGFLVEKEIVALDRVKRHPEHPYVVIMGGAKVSDKIGVMLQLLNQCNTLLIGGAMAYTFLHFKGYKIGRSKVELDQLKLVEDIFNAAEKRNVEIKLPLDHIVAKSFEASSEAVYIPHQDINGDYMGLDIGPNTIEAYCDIIDNAKTIMWNGPMGVFEWENFSKGTFSIAKSVGQSRGYTVVGGGESVSALKLSGFYDKVSHVSTGGGASLKYLEGAKLPGLEALR